MTQHLVQFAHGTLVKNDDHSVKVNKEDHSDFHVAAEDLTNPLAVESEAKEDAKAKAKADEKKEEKK